MLVPLTCMGPARASRNECRLSEWYYYKEHIEYFVVLVSVSRLFLANSTLKDIFNLCSIHNNMLRDVIYFHSVHSLLVTSSFYEWILLAHCSASYFTRPNLISVTCNVVICLGMPGVSPWQGVIDSQAFGSCIGH